MSAPITISRQDGACTIRMNRPEKKNAITLAMYSAMTEALIATNDDADIRVVLFLGVPGAFSAGNDIADFVDMAKGGALGQEIVDFLKALATCEKPVVAGVDGLAVGIGTTLLLHCDMVIASETSRFITPFVNLALVPEAASSLIAPRMMGHAKAFELLCLGAPFSPQDAKETGIINRITTSEALEADALALAGELAAKPAGALRAARALLRGKPEDILSRIDEEAEAFKGQLASDEARAAFAAFMAK